MRTQVRVTLTHRTSVRLAIAYSSQVGSDVRSQPAPPAGGSARSTPPGSFHHVRAGVGQRLAQAGTVQRHAVGRAGAFEAPAFGQGAGIDHVETDPLMEGSDDALGLGVVAGERQRAPIGGAGRARRILLDVALEDRIEAR